MMTPTQVLIWLGKKLAKLFLSWMGFAIFIVSVLIVWAKMVDFSKLDIGGMPTDWVAEQWILLAIALTVGMFLLFFFGKVWKWLLAIVVISLIFSGPRDWLMDWINRPEIKVSVFGKETVRSVLVTKLDGFDICDLEANASYTFIEAKTERQNGDEVSYRIRHKTSHSEEPAKITGDFFSEPEKLPYPDRNYAGGILVNGIPPKRIVTTDDKGCLIGSFNMEGTQYFDIVPIRIGVSLRKNG